MKTKTNARVLSWLVALCMIVAVIPAMPAEYASAATGATYVYDFGASTTGYTTSTPLAQADNSGTLNVNSSAIETLNSNVAANSKANGTQSWEFAEYAVSQLNTTKLLSGVANGSLYIQARTTRYAEFTLTFQVPKDGYYNASAFLKRTFPSASTDHEVDVSIREFSEAKPENARVFASYVQSVAAQNDAAFTETPLEGTPYLQANTTYRLYVKYKAGNTGGYENYFYISKFTLTEAIPEIVATNAYPTAMEIGDTVKLDVTGVSLGDESYPATVSVAVTDELEKGDGAISVGEDGTLTAVKAGGVEVTVTATYDTDKTVSSKHYITVRPETADNEYVYYMSGHSADNVMLLGSAAGKSYNTASQEWTFSKFSHSSNGVRDRSQFQNWRGVNITVNGTSESGAADIIIQAPETGWYALGAEISKVENVDVSYELKNANKVLASCNVDSSVTDEYVADNAVYLEKGVDYTFSFAAAVTPGQSVSRARSYLWYIKLTSIPGSEIFGDTYAYVKDGTVYFLGGLKTIEGYSEVGFEVTVNGEKVDDIKTSEVYTSFQVKNQTVNASEWDSDYIFITSIDGLSIGDKVIVKPYIANGEVKTYHADAFALKLDI